MKQVSVFHVFAFLSVLMVTLSSCEIIGGIFKAGVWVGIIVVALVLFLVVRLLSR